MHRTDQIDHDLDQIDQADQIDHDLDHVVPHRSFISGCAGSAWYRSNPGKTCHIHYAEYTTGQHELLCYCRSYRAGSRSALP